jgi:hypothetical protein
MMRHGCRSPFETSARQRWVANDADTLLVRTYCCAGIHGCLYESTSPLPGDVLTQSWQNLDRVATVRSNVPKELHNDPSIDPALCAQPLYKTADVRHRGTKASKICLQGGGLSPVTPHRSLDGPVGCLNLIIMALRDGPRLRQQARHHLVASADSYACFVPSHYGQRGPSPRVA